MSAWEVVSADGFFRRHTESLERVANYLSYFDEVEIASTVQILKAEFQSTTWDERIYGVPPVTEGPPHDFVITTNGELRIGLGHFHLSGNASNVLAAGRIKVNIEGKIWWMDGTSGHYLPGLENPNELDAMRAILYNNNLTSFPGE